MQHTNGTPFQNPKWKITRLSIQTNLVCMYMRMYIVHRGVCMCTMKSHLQFIDSTSTMICKKTLIFTDPFQDVFRYLNCEQTCKQQLRVPKLGLEVWFWGHWSTSVILGFIKENRDRSRKLITISTTGFENLCTDSYSK